MSVARLEKGAYYRGSRFRKSICSSGEMRSPPDKPKLVNSARSVRIAIVCLVELIFHFYLQPSQVLDNTTPLSWRMLFQIAVFVPNRISYNTVPWNYKARPFYNLVSSPISELQILKVEAGENVCLNCS